MTKTVWIERRRRPYEIWMDGEMIGTAKEWPMLRAIRMLLDRGVRGHVEIHDREGVMATLDRIEDFPGRAMRTLQTAVQLAGVERAP